MPNTRAGAEGWAGHNHPITPVSFLPLESSPVPAEFHSFPSEASAEQPAELDGKNEGKKEGQTKAELHRDYGRSAVGISPLEIHIQQWEPALLLPARSLVAVELLLLPSCARSEALG